MLASIVDEASDLVTYATYLQRDMFKSLKGSALGRGSSPVDRSVKWPRSGGLWLAALFGTVACESVIAQDQPCSKCGPGAHWIDACAAGQDLVDDHVVIAGIDLIPGGDCPASISANLEPCAAPDDLLVVNRSEPRDVSTRFAGFRPADGHLDVIDTELISMCLTNPEMNITYRAGAGTGVGPQGANLQASYGAIGELTGSGALLGESFFEIFFEIEVIMGGGPPTYLYNHAPLRMEAIITCVPPATEYNAFLPENCLPLFNDPDPGEGEWIADGTSAARHVLYEEEEGCCWRCVGGTVECTSPVVATACAFNFVPGGVCGTPACGSCDQPPPPPPPIPANSCDDCNHNGTPDDLEIAMNSGLDNDLNGLIDDCELTDYSQDWEVGFNTSGVGEQNSLDEQNGWSILQTTGYSAFVRGPNYNAVAPDYAGFASCMSGPAVSPPQTCLMVFDSDHDSDIDLRDFASFQVNGFPQSGMDGPDNHFLVVRDLGPGDAAGLIMGPRADSLKEADIELWCWDMFFTSNSFGRYMFEIADICSDSPLTTQDILAGIDSIPGNEDEAGEPYIDAINTGLEFRGGNVDNNPNRVTILADVGGGKRYDAGSGLDGIAFTFGEPSFPVQTACIRIHNRLGTVNAMMGNVGVGPPWTNLSNFLFLGNRTETTPTGGDKQFIIRHAEQSDGTTELWFDNLRYIARDDCDLDGVGDDFYLNYMSPLPGHNEQDANNDGILDRCQDCDNDCGGFPITFAQRGCLDPCEISAAACGGVGGGSQDCNGNGIPDHCDIAADGNGNFGGGAPIEIGPQAGLGCLFPGFGCKVVRYVGASFDCNENGIPDECDAANSVCEDCNGNGKCDDGEISGAAGAHCGPVDDCNANIIPDECEGDCNSNGIPDECELAFDGCPP